MDKTITNEGRKLFYREEGSGQPVLLLHGFAEDGKLWDPIIPRLKTGYRLLIPDLPGSGRSTLLPGEPSIDALAESIKILIDAEGIDKCILIGHSMGGYISLSFAEQYPQRLKAFGLFHSTAYADSEEKKAARRKGIGFIRQHGAAPFVRQSTPNLFAPGTRESRPQLIEDIIRSYSGFSAESLVYYYEAMIQRPDRTRVLQQFAGAILFIIGEKDQAVPYESSLKQCHEPTIAHIHILENAGHMGMLEEPEDSGNSVESFLNFVYT
ncbi:alpha/beta fold hydrolase [Puia dinghuensis]|uniref:Alpha/beta hydrolase n=1 Tax=Puia dinghuensis TaxID=1792502 RepID=A0A8J2XWB7_9BACT|nr:alpha/beta hydrolase [Puia dinghuensis]GGB22562.1 alpha/beta hydrolase [Puia dinghuensis]